MSLEIEPQFEESRNLLDTVERQKLFEVIATGLDRTAADTAYKEFRKHYKDKIGLAEGPYFHCKIYQEYASEEAIDAHARLTEENLGLVGFAINIHGSPNQGLMNYDDLFQEGWIALSKSVWQYDSGRVAAFSTFAVPVIANHLSRVKAYRSFAVSLKPGHVELAHRLRRKYPDLNRVLHNTSSVQQLEENHGKYEIDGIIAIESMFRYVRSLDESFGRQQAEFFDYDGQPTTRNILGNITDQLPTNTHDEMEQEIIHEVAVTEGIRILLDTAVDERERFVLELRFGLADGEQKTLEEVGEVIGVTRERVRQIESRAMAKIRHAIRKSNRSNNQPGDWVDGLPSYKRKPQGAYTALASADSVNDKKLEELRNSEEAKRVRERKFELLRIYQPRIHAWGGFLEQKKAAVPHPQGKVLEEFMMLVLADNLPDYVIQEKTSLTPEFLRELKSHEAIKEIGKIPEVRNESVKTYLDNFANQLAELFHLAQHETHQHFAGAGRSYVRPDHYGYEFNQFESRLLREEGYKLLKAHRQYPSNEFIEARADKYKWPETHLLTESVNIDRKVESSKNRDAANRIKLSSEQSDFLKQLEEHIETPVDPRLLLEAVELVVGGNADLSKPSVRESLEWYIVERL